MPRFGSDWNDEWRIYPLGSGITISSNNKCILYTYLTAKRLRSTYPPTHMTISSKHSRSTRLEERIDL
ncbi:MAG: hypothetical protein LUC91_10500 [Prevotella sp.]|nr:hypothetical protein [Prevotella sp.]